MPSQMPSKAHTFDAKSTLDRSTVLCLACSSSLPPLKHSYNPSSSSSYTKVDPNAIFTTNCCQRPICPACIRSNPRLARYDPCLACLGGVSVVGVASSSSRSASAGLLSPKGLKSPGATYKEQEIGYNYNLDGAVRDEDTFVLGDDEDEDDDDDDPKPEEYVSGAGGMLYENTHHNWAPPPPYEAPGDEWSSDEKSSGDPSGEGEDVSATNPQVSLSRNKSSGSDLVVSAPPPASAADEELASNSSAPYKYYISRGDTLQGISLRFGVDSQEICKLNKLPTSVMRTMPQLLHTRAFLLLPASAKAASASSSSPAAPLKTTPVTDDKVRAREALLTRERAGKRLQTFTKEVDYHLAKAYVALADDPEEQEMASAKRKEIGSSVMGGSNGASSRGTAWASGSRGGPASSSTGHAPQGDLEALAIQQYLEDNEWEEEERRAGRGPLARPLPPPSPFSFAAIASKVGL